MNKLYLNNIEDKYMLHTYTCFNVMESIMPLSKFCKLPWGLKISKQLTGLIFKFYEDFNKHCD